MLILLAIACTTDELSQSYEIDRVRVLGAAAEPAEPKPGDVVTFSSLVVSPNEPLFGTAWLACAGDQASDFGCEFDESLFSDPENVDPEALAAAGFIGFEPYIPPTWTVPTDYLDALTDEEKLEGTAAFINIIAIPGDGSELDEDADVEIAYKRVPVSLATTPNHNPVLSGLRVDGIDVAEDGIVELDAGQTYEIEAVLQDDSVETYTYVSSDGESEERTEEPYFSWYLQKGSFDQTNTLYPFTSVNYTTPADGSADDLGLWVVVRDRRGGMSWSQMTVRVRSTGS